ncbi:hypothetical protein [Aliivibrio logei]|uniref:hypothetical protein n=1 Tax=Aliivibrio logei TaxID=688 RepID=UPI0035C9296A
MTHTFSLDHFLPQAVQGQQQHNPAVQGIYKSSINPDCKHIEINCVNNQGGLIESYRLVKDGIEHAITNGKTVTVNFSGYAYSCAALLYVYVISKPEVLVTHNNVRLGFHTAQISVQFQTIPKKYTMEKFEEEYNRGLPQMKVDEDTVRTLYEQFITNILKLDQVNIDISLEKYDENANMMFNVRQGQQGRLAYEAS